MKLSIQLKVTENESEDSDDITTADTQTDNNTQPDDTHQIYHRNNDLKEMNKTKNKITKNVHRSNGIRVGNVNQRPQSQNYKNSLQ